MESQAEDHGSANEKAKVKTTNSVIDNNGKGSTDVHMSAVNKLLHGQFPDMDGLNDTVLGSKLQFPVSRNIFCQILHVGGNHWLAIANKFCNTDEIDVYDSLLNSVVPDNISISSDVIIQAAAILCTKNPTMICNVRKFGQQKGSTDCGLFAIAAVVSICFGVDPSCVLFEKSKMRNHLITRLEKGSFEQFPSVLIDVEELVIKRIPVTLYCNCRLPDNGEEKMARCDSCKIWFHKSCQKIPSAIFRSKSEV